MIGHDRLCVFYVRDQVVLRGLRGRRAISDRVDVARFGETKKNTHNIKHNVVGKNSKMPHARGDCDSTICTPRARATRTDMMMRMTCVRAGYSSIYVYIICVKRDIRAM